MYTKYLIYLSTIFLVLSGSIVAQDNKGRKSSQSKAIFDLSKSLQDGEPDEKVALEYEKTAKEQIALEQYAKAEDYLKRAKKLYEKLKNKEKVAYIDREIAKVQELQNKLPEAIESYYMAGKVSEDKIQQEINTNDAQRLKNNTNPQAKSSYIQQNINLLEKTSNKEERSNAYKQMAEVNLEMNNKQEAINNFEYALKETQKPVEIIKINKDIANIYAADQQTKKAIDINRRLLKVAEKTQDTKIQVEQLQSLSNAYFEGHDTLQGLSSLQDAYNLAMNEGHTMEAKKSIELIINQYKKDKNTIKALELYSDFMNRLETTIKADSSFMDARLLQLNEDKIKQLERERSLSEQLIMKKNILNYALIALITLILIFLIFTIKALYSIKIKNKKIALQSLRREMNPHFIFNSLNSINHFIAQNNELEANKYLSSYSKLMRNIMENSNKDFITLATEVEQLQEYLDLEHMRFQDKFSYQIDIDNLLDTDSILVPNMLIQPQLENAIWHGLRYKENDGQLILSIKQYENSLLVIIDDNGIGLKKSKELKTKHQKIHHSRGLNNTLERIGLLNKLYNSKITIDITEKRGKEAGVIVTIIFPLTLK